jgi:hypothetical protein
MSGRKLFSSILMACLLTAGFLGNGSVASAASAWPALLKPGEHAQNNVAENNVIEIKHRRRGKRGNPLYLPIVPYSAYDYPYYYRRGYYPTHVGPGYIYYGYPYFYRKRYSDRCPYRHQRCVARQKGGCRCR